MSAEAPTTPIVTYRTHVLDLPSAEVGDGVNDQPRDGTTEVDNLVEHEAHQTGCDDRVAHPDVVARPCSLQPVQVLQVDIPVKLILRSRGVADSELLSDDGRDLVQEIHSCRGHLELDKVL